MRWPLNETAGKSPGRHAGIGHSDCGPHAATDATPFPQGRAQQVTIDLQPVAVLFRAGERIRLTVAAADPDSFQLLPADGRASYRIGHGGARPSYVELPVVR
ncbi:CocE/NonD family hydrolase C-terminal non-catalytic domain-containing protein [Kitasatospora sp. NPDC087314]|uniref:CocE/NonD family hydrolase C-terminal non-catalytic domain-containing protein n=1 Tax=Kitasatospora sp. NPDC087314 TaxID=3364068 RepID=UPI0037F92F88